MNKTSITPSEHRIFKKIQRDIAAGRIPNTHQNNSEVVKSYADADFRNILAYFVNDVRRQKGEDLDHEAKPKDATSQYNEGRGTERQLIGQDSSATLAKPELRGAGNNLSFVPGTVAQGLDHGPDRDRPHHTSYRRPSFLTGVREAEVQEAQRVDLDSIEDEQARHLGRQAESYDDFVDLIAEREMQRLSQSLVESIGMVKRTPDMAIWEACESLVFPLITLLDEPKPRKQKAQPKEASSIAADPSLSKSPPRQSIRQVKSELLPNTPDDISSLSVISRVFPAAVVLALRLLARHTPSSPFALALLPKIRSLGPLSYVLGGTTPFYNALIKLEWDVYSHFKAVDELLCDMQRGGIEWDLETYGILSEIQEERNQDIQRPPTEEITSWSRSKSWWERTTQKHGYQKVCVEWKAVIGKKLREQGLGNAMASKEFEARVSRGGVAETTTFDPPLVVL